MPQIALALSPKTGKYLKFKCGQGHIFSCMVFYKIFSSFFFTILLGGAQETINSCKNTPLSLNPKYF